MTSPSNSHTQLFTTCVGATAISLTLLYRIIQDEKQKKDKQTHYSYNFDEPVDRSSIFSVKYDLRSLIFGPKSQSATPLWVADMDLPISPTIRKSLMKRSSHPCGIGYTIQPTEAWEAVVQWLHTRFNWTSVDTSQIIFSASVVTSVANVIRTFTKVGDSVLCMTPLYYPLQGAVTGTGRDLVRHQLQLCERNGRYQIDFVELEKQITSNDVKILILCNPHNPSGRVWSTNELQTIVNICRAHDVLILSDEIWCDWILSWAQNEIHTPISSLSNGASDICITLMAPTKTWNLAGIHSSFVIIQNSDLCKRYRQYVEPAYLHYGNAFSTESLLATYGSSCDANNGNGEAVKWLEEAKNYVEGNIELMAQYIAKHIPQLKVIPSDATYLVWIDCSGLGGDFAEHSHRFFLEEAQVLLSPGGEFSPETCHFVRINVACSRKVLRGALERMAAATKAKTKG